MAPRPKRKFRPPRTLVTGGAGFLGSHLCDRLVAEGHEVFCVDNLLTGALANLQHLRKHPRFHFLRRDVTKPTLLESLPRDPKRSGAGGRGSANRFDYILHLACPASPQDYLEHPIDTLRAGAIGTYHALELARKHGSVFLLTSSSEVYGDPEVTPQRETYWGHVNPIGPRSVYDEAKRFAESLAMAYHRRYGVRVRIARIFNTYGERMRNDDGRVLPNFLTQALRGKPLTVYGNGSQTRSFCYVSDMVEGLYRLLLSEETGPVNLGNPQEVTILEVAREVIELAGSRSKIVFRPLPTDDPRRRRPDISRAITRLHWQPQVGRRLGIQRLIADFQVRLRRKAAG